MRPVLCFLCTVSAPAAFICSYIYSSDDCSGDLKSTTCYHDGKCWMSDVPVIEQCTTAGAGFTVSKYEAGDYDCNGTVVSQETYSNQGCSSEPDGTTIKTACKNELPAGATLRV